MPQHQSVQVQATPEITDQEQQLNVDQQHMPALFNEKVPSQCHKSPCSRGENYHDRYNDPELQSLVMIHETDEFTAYFRSRVLFDPAYHGQVKEEEKPDQ